MLELLELSGLLRPQAYVKVVSEVFIALSNVTAIGAIGTSQAILAYLLLGLLEQLGL